VENGVTMKKYLAIIFLLIVLLAGYSQQHRVRSYVRSVWLTEGKRVKGFKYEKNLKNLIFEQDLSSWLSLYVPDKTSNGYLLVFFKKRVPILLDMNGNLVHAWPDVRGRTRMRLMPNGDLLVIGSDNFIREYDWEGRLIWEFELKEKDDFPHHDIINTTNGNIMLICRDFGNNSTDYLLEVNRDGEAVWQWNSIDCLDTVFRDQVMMEGDPTHINSIQELPPNRWYDSGDTRFRPGNILISARHLNSIFIVDRETGDITWTYSDGLDYQHEALMIEREFPQGGNILVFNNGCNNLYRYRSSSILEIDPQERTVQWEYSAKYFFSSSRSVEQFLPNGNILITSDRGRRIFEITREGEIVWEWLPPFDPMRPQRYPYNYCTKFEELDRPVEVAVDNRTDDPYIDLELYAFGLDQDVDKLKLYGRERKILKNNKMCRDLILPTLATLEVSYGLDPAALTEGGTSGVSAIFTMSISRKGSPESVLLLEDRVSSVDDSTWLTRTIPLSEYAYETTTLCIDVDRIDMDSTVVGEVSRVAVWENPSIVSSHTISLDVQAAVDSLSGREKEIMLQQLKALGYVD